MIEGEEALLLLVGVLSELFVGLLRCGFVIMAVPQHHGKMQSRLFPLCMANCTLSLVTSIQSRD